MLSLILSSLLAVLLSNIMYAQDIDTSPHKIQFVTVDKNVRLEVLDWGGSGRPVVLLAGLGSDAHVFDKFAPNLTGECHLYGITRRGYGSSSAPVPTDEKTYSADRLGDDVLSVIDQLHLDRPVLVGHSIAGEELSSVGSRHSEKVAGLIYLDAGYGYAFYDASLGWLDIDVVDVQKELDLLRAGKGPNDTRPAIRELLDTMLPRLDNDLRQEHEYLGSVDPAMITGDSLSMTVASQAILAGEKKYTRIGAPILAIFAVPHDMGKLVGSDPARRAVFDAHDEASTGAQATAFEKGLPTARIVRLTHANHFVFRSNEKDVLREMKAFLGSLP
jgi:non-heme chloroperoxidase